MKVLVLLFLLAVVAAAPAPRQNYDRDNVQLLRYENKNEGRRHSYNFELSDGTKQEQRGELKNEGQDNEVYAVSGSYTWIGPDGQKIVVSYVADEDGYQPTIEEGPGALPADCIGSCIG